MRITDDLDALLNVIPPDIQAALRERPDNYELLEVVMDLGRLPQARYPGREVILSQREITQEDIDYVVSRVGEFTADNRAGIERTLHRISAIRNRRGRIVGLTLRVGRAVFGTVRIIQDLLATGKSILLLGRPGVGKTTLLREAARYLADELKKRVIVVDTSNEIAGDGDIPHPGIGSARRMQVPSPTLQHQVMIEAVENHMPEAIIIDEIGTELEALAARTIAERGVQLIGTAHGNQIENLMKNPTLADLIGGIQAVTLGDEEARRRGTQKTVLERKAPPTFTIAVEMQERYRWVIHERVAETVDNLLRGRRGPVQVRTLGDDGRVTITHELPSPEPATPMRRWRRAGRILALPEPSETRGESAHWFEQVDEMEAAAETDEPVHVYPYGVSLELLHQVVATLDLPVVLVRDINQADVMLVPRAQARQNPKVRQMAKSRQLPVYTVKGNTIPHITRALRRLLRLDEGEPGEDWPLLTQGRDDDEVEALEEARLAVEQIVIPTGQPVELLPRPPEIRKMQHELVEHYRLRSMSFGEEPNRRLRIFPA
ncbi:MAG: AAA family ATPase [Dehalococcoidia bacterium]|nr:AAA family ATPase [Dehalococcoidia bacterium]